LGPESQFLVAVREPPATRHSASRRGGSGMMSSSLADLLRTPAHAPALRVPACARVGRRRAAGVTGSYAPCSFFFFLFAPLMHAPVRTTALRLWATSWAVREFSSCSQVQDLRIASQNERWPRGCTCAGGGSEQRSRSSGSGGAGLAAAIMAAVMAVRKARHRKKTGHMARPHGHPSRCNGVISNGAPAPPLSKRRVTFPQAAHLSKIAWSCAGVRS
jgi:hypothetical protein